MRDSRSAVVAIGLALASRNACADLENRSTGGKGRARNVERLAQVHRDHRGVVHWQSGNDYLVRGLAGAVQQFADGSSPKIVQRASCRSLGWKSGFGLQQSDCGGPPRLSPLLLSFERSCLVVVCGYATTGWGLCASGILPGKWRFKGTLGMGEGAWAAVGGTASVVSDGQQQVDGEGSALGRGGLEEAVYDTLGFVYQFKNMIA